jgi:hypothetical protein
MTDKPRELVGKLSAMADCLIGIQCTTPEELGPRWGGVVREAAAALREHLEKR